MADALQELLGPVRAAAAIRYDRGKRPNRRSACQAARTAPPCWRWRRRCAVLSDPVHFDRHYAGSLRRRQGNGFLPLTDWCASLGYPTIIRRTRLWEIVFEERKEPNPCSLCSYAPRRAAPRRQGRGMPVHCPGPPPGRRGGNVSDEPAGGRNTFLLFAQILSVQPGPVPDPAAALSQREAGGLRRPRLQLPVVPQAVPPMDRPTASRPRSSLPGCPKPTGRWTRRFSPPCKKAACPAGKPGQAAFYFKGSLFPPRLPGAVQRLGIGMAAESRCARKHFQQPLILIDQDFFHTETPLPAAAAAAGQGRSSGEWYTSPSNWKASHIGPQPGPPHLVVCIEPLINAGQFFHLGLRTPHFVLIGNIIHLQPFQLGA